MSSIRLKHASGNAVIIAAPSSNPSSNKTINLPDEAGVFATKDSNDNLQNITAINGGSIGTKNLIINGAMQVAARGTSSTANTYGTVDRFRVAYTGTDEAPTQAQVDVAAGTTPYTLGFRKAFKVTNGNQTSGAGADDAITFVYTVEDQDLATSGWNHKSSSSNITISFWVKSSVAQNFYFTIQSDNSSQYRYVMKTGSLTADTWTKITKTIPGNTNLVFNNDNGHGVFIIWNLFNGTNRTGTRPLNAWAALDNTSRTPDMTSTWYITNDATFEMTGVQLEVGNTATTFEHLPISQTIALCQRYFQKLDIPGNSYSAQYSDNGYFYGSPIPFIVEMRALPTTITYSNISGQNYWVEVGIAAFSASSTTSLSFNKNFTTFCSLNQARQTGNATPTRREIYIWEPRFNLLIDAEL